VKTYINFALRSYFWGQKEEYLGNNLVGVCTDRGSNTSSKKDKGLANRIQEQYSQVFVANDYSHIFNSTCKHSFKKWDKLNGENN